MNDLKSRVRAEHSAPIHELPIEVFVSLCPLESRVVRYEQNLFAFYEWLKLDEAFFGS
jgi:hypothetical protein